MKSQLDMNALWEQSIAKANIALRGLKNARRKPANWAIPHSPMW